LTGSIRRLSIRRASSVFNGTYSACVSEVVIDDNLNDVLPQINPDYQRAVELGYQLVKKFDPEATLTQTCEEGQRHCFRFSSRPKQMPWQRFGWHINYR